MAEVRWGGVGLVCRQNGNRAVLGPHRDPALEVLVEGRGQASGPLSMERGLFRDLSSPRCETGIMVRLLGHWEDDG